MEIIIQHRGRQSSRAFKSALLTCLVGIFIIFYSHASLSAYPVARLSTVETFSDSIYVPSTQQTWISYLSGSDVVLKRFDAAGHMVGSILYPIAGSTGNLPAITAPTIVFSDVSNQIVIAALIDAPVFNRVFLYMQRYDLQGNKVGGLNIIFVADEFYPPVGNPIAGLHLTHNELTDEIVASVQITENNAHIIRAVRYDLGGISGNTGYVSGSERDLYNSGLNGFTSHGLAHAPLSNVTGGRYLFVVDGNAMLLDSTLEPIPVNITGQAYASTHLPLQWGEPNGQYAQFDVAFGTIEGQKRFLVVWSDANNCMPTYGTNCSAIYQQATGVWGTFIDPRYLEFGDRTNTPFPITGNALVHVGNKYLYTPRVIYNFDAEAFVVGWREVPFYNANNDESRSHIRAAAITNFIPENLAGTTLLGLPPKNYVITNVSGTCGTGPCFSDQDPVLPSLTDSYGAYSTIIWSEKFIYNPSDIDIFAEAFLPDSPNNDAFNNAILLPENGTVKGTTVFATDEGIAGCGLTNTARDVWYYYVAPQKGTLEVNTCGTNNYFGFDDGVDTVISLHQSNGTEISNSCNDDWPSKAPLNCTMQDTGLKRDSATSIELQSGQQVWVRVTSYADIHPGQFFLNTVFTPN